MEQFEKLKVQLEVFDFELRQDGDQYIVKEELEDGYGEETHDSIDSVQMWWSGFIACATRCQIIPEVKERVERLQRITDRMLPKLSNEELKARFTIVESLEEISAEELFSMNPFFLNGEDGTALLVNHFELKNFQYRANKEVILGSELIVSEDVDLMLYVSEVSSIEEIKAHFGES